MVDAMLGRVLTAIDKAGISENTIVVFTSDNGCSPSANFGELKAKGHNPSYTFRGHKADLFDGGHRIPCVVRWPAKIKPHQVDQTISLNDFMATFANITGYKLKDNEGEDSYNLMPLLLNTNPQPSIREATVHHSIDGAFAIRKGDWKLLFSAGSGGWSSPKANETNYKSLPPYQLYNLKSDPGEMKNLYAEHPAVGAELRALMLKYIQDGRSTPGAPQKNDGKEIIL
jgi:arylsulfatase A-like enzyme